MASDAGKTIMRANGIVLEVENKNYQMIRTKEGFQFSAILLFQNLEHAQEERVFRHYRALNIQLSKCPYTSILCSRPVGALFEHIMVCTCARLTAFSLSAFAY